MDSHHFHPKGWRPNILIDGQGTIKVADFGISVISQSARTSLENPHGRAGTAWYMAPEQIQSKPSRASDQYALAIIVYEWLTGELPFTGGIMEVWGQHLYATPDPLPKTIPMLSDEVEAVIMRALAKNPKDRYPTIQDFASALEAAYTTEVQRHQPPKVKPTLIEGKTKEQWFNEGIAHHNAKSYEKAVAAYSKAIELDPNYTYAYHNRGAVYKEQKRYEEALRDFTKAIELDPNDPDYYNGRGLVYKAQKRYEEALRDYNKAIELNPNDAYAYQNRGNAYDDLKNYRRAVADYDRALELGIDIDGVRAYRDVVFKKLNKG